MKVLTKVANKATNLMGRSGLVIKKFGPEAMVVVGVIGVTAATVMLFKKGEELDDILEEHKDRVEEAKAESKTDNERRKAVTKAYVATGKDMVKTYGPAVSLYTASIASILGGHNIVRKRYAATTAAYKVLEESFEGYRARVRDAYGEEKEKDLYLGRSKKDISVTEIGEDGEDKEKKVKGAVVAEGEPSPYAKFFDASSRDWQDNPEHNLMFLKGQQNYFNQLLQARGHVFLNEVYDALDIPRTPAGQVVGWIKGAGDDFIDFGIYDLYHEKNRDFVNGYEPVILLDFNVDGMIYEKI